MVLQVSGGISEKWRLNPPGGGGRFSHDKERKTDRKKDEEKKKERKTKKDKERKTKKERQRKKDKERKAKKERKEGRKWAPS